MGGLLKVLVIFVVCVGLAEPLAERVMGPRYSELKSRARAVLVPMAEAAWAAAKEAWQSARAREHVLPSAPVPERQQDREALADDVPRFAHAALVREVEGQVLASLDEPRRHVVRRALSLVGTPYVWGGESERGADCSGLVFLLYDEVGVRLPRRSKELFRATHAVKIPDVAPGDLVFFQNSNGRAGHVGVFVGRGLVVHASSSRGEAVVDTLEVVSANNGLNGIRRVLTAEAL